MNDQIQQLHARIADLEAQLYAVGAGGVEPLRKTDTAAQALKQGEQVAPYTGDVARIMREAGMTFHLGLPHKAVVEQMTRVVDLVYAEASIKAAVAFAAPKPAAHQEPAAWCVHPFDYGVGSKGVYALTMRPEQVEMWTRKGWGVEPLYTAPQPTEKLHCKSTQKRLATLWGYVKQESARQPLTDEQIIAIADNARAAESGDAGYILPIAFARAIEEALGITGGQQ